MKIGDHLVSDRILYTHHGLYIGNQLVIHYSGSLKKNDGEGIVEAVTLEEFSQGNPVHVQHHRHRKYSPEESVKRAHARLGEDWYHLILNNCEHFVTWCIHGTPVSEQVNRTMLHVTRSQIPSTLPLTTMAKTIKRAKKTTQSASLALAATGSGLMTSSSSAGITSAVAAFGGGSASGLIAAASSVATPLAPVVAAIAVGCLIDYGLKKLFD